MIATIAATVAALAAALASGCGPRLERVGFEATDEALANPERGCGARAKTGT